MSVSDLQPAAYITEDKVAQHKQESYLKHHKTSEGRLQHFCISTKLSCFVYCHFGPRLLKLSLVRKNATNVSCKES